MVWISSVSWLTLSLLPPGLDRSWSECCWCQLEPVGPDMLRPTPGYAPIWLDKPTWVRWWSCAPGGLQKTHRQDNKGPHILGCTSVRRTCPRKDPFLWRLPGGNMVNGSSVPHENQFDEVESRVYITSYYFKVDINMIKVNMMRWCHRNASKKASQQQALLAIFTQILTWCIMQIIKTRNITSQTSSSAAEQTGSLLSWIKFFYLLIFFQTMLGSDDWVYAHFGL